MSRPTVYAMVSTHDSLAYTRLAIASFFAETVMGPADQLLVIDNDGSVGSDTIGPYQDRLEVLVNPRPLTFAENGNRLLARTAEASADLFFMNNDLVFGPGWNVEVAALPDHVLAAPVCNNLFPYTGHTGWVLPKSLRLDDFHGHEEEFRALCRTHATQHPRIYDVPFYYFYCVRISPTVQQRVGLFDEQFRLGGEDIDYCLRCHLAGVPVQYAGRSYVLHFQGKSTWDGPEQDSATEARNARYREIFRNKWGEDLLELLAWQNFGVLNKYPDAAALYDAERYTEALQIVAASLR